MQHTDTAVTLPHTAALSALFDVLVVLRLALYFLVDVLINMLHCSLLHFESQKHSHVHAASPTRASPSVTHLG